MLPLIAERQITVTVHSLLVATVEAEPLIAAPAAVDCTRLVTATRGLSAEIRTG